MTTALALAGYVFAFVGLAISGTAYFDSAKSEGRDPWPWLTWSTVRVRRLIPFRRRRSITLDIHPAEIGITSEHVRLVQTGPEVPADAPLAEQIRLLLQRIKVVQSQADVDRRAYDEAAKSLRKEFSEQTARLDQAIQQVASESKALVLDTVPQQFLGLILTGFGLALAFVAFLLDV